MVTRKARKKDEKENLELLELAVSCRLITAEQEKKILPKILAKSGKKDKISAARYLYKEKILEKDQIEFLFTVKKHLHMLMQDKKFGKLGVANEFVTPENIKKALSIQVEIFKQRKKSVMIGDILVNSNNISEADKTAILLTQDRIRDKYLADALNAIAKNELERSAINKRFGAIAVKKELITTEQLNQALKHQKKEAKSKGTHRYLGEILKELFELSEKDTMRVLKIQKKLETRRMNLQKNVFAFNVENESIKTLDHFIQLSISDDKLQAFIIQKTGDKPGIDINDLMNWLSNSGIKFGVIDKEQLDKALDGMRPGKKIGIAKGVPPVQPEPEKVSFLVDVRDIDADNSSKDDAAEKTLVKKDEVIAKIVPFKEGRPGKDVFGHPIGVETAPYELLNSGEGVSRQGNEFISLIEGEPCVYKSRTLYVIPAENPVEEKQIEGDISGETEDAYVDCDLKVSGNITPEASVACHSIVVEGNVLGSITAVDTIEVNGDIGSVEDIETAEPVIRIATHGKVKVGGKVICARIVTDKGLSAPQSDVVNSRIFSSGDIIANNIYSGKEHPSVIRIAMKNTVELQKIEQEIKKEQKELDGMTLASQVEKLSNKLMEQVQVQNGYLEKQNVLSYLTKILGLPEYEDITNIDEKLKRYEKKNKQLPEKERQETIPENTKAYQFLKKIKEKLKDKTPEDQQKYVDELYEQITGMYKAAVKVTDRINKKVEAHEKQARDLSEKHKEKIQAKKENIRDLMAKKDNLIIEAKNSGAEDQLLVKVKNELAQGTVIKGEQAELVVDKPVHGVFVRERGSTAEKKGEMVMDGYFEQ